MLYEPLRLIAVRVDFTLSFGCFTCAGVSEEKNALVKSANCAFTSGHFGIGVSLIVNGCYDG